MSVKAMGRPFGCVVQKLRVGRGGRAGMTPGANQVSAGPCCPDRVDHKDNKRDEGEHDDDFLSRSHARDLVLARRLLGGNHALGKAHLVTARLRIDELGTSGLFRLRFRCGRRGFAAAGLGRAPVGCALRGSLLGLAHARHAGQPAPHARGVPLPGPRDEPSRRGALPTRRVPRRTVVGTQARPWYRPFF